MERKLDQNNFPAEKEKIERSECFKSLFASNDTIAYGFNHFKSR
jgi:hypothetical protein